MAHYGNIASNPKSACHGSHLIQLPSVPDEISFPATKSGVLPFSAAHNLVVANLSPMGTQPIRAEGGQLRSDSTRSIPD